MQQFELELEIYHFKRGRKHDVTSLRNTVLVCMFNKTTQHSYQTLK